MVCGAAYREGTQGTLDHFGSLAEGCDPYGGTRPYGARSEDS